MEFSDIMALDDRDYYIRKPCTHRPTDCEKCQEERRQKQLALEAEVAEKRLAHQNRCKDWVEKIRKMSGAAE